MLNFKTITIEDKKLLMPFFMKYGESSCQYSMSLMTGLAMKYGDEYAIADDVLYIHRSKLDTDQKRVYLPPLGEYLCLNDPVSILLRDAGEYNSGITFMTGTKAFKEYLEKNYPGQFIFEESEDYAEYIYRTEDLCILPGKALAAKRNRVRAFYSTYEGYVRIEDISESNWTDVYLFQKDWIENRLAEGYDEMLARENEAIKFWLMHFNELDFKGIVVYVKGTVVGYAAGVALNDDCMDEVIEKGRKDIVGIYQLLCNEFALLCCRGYNYINREEDLGVEGLRRAKTSYRPEYMLEKYIITGKE